MRLSHLDLKIMTKTTTKKSKTSTTKSTTTRKKSTPKPIEELPLKPLAFEVLDLVSRQRSKAKK